MFGVTRCDHSEVGRCLLGRFGGRPHIGVCRLRCPLCRRYDPAAATRTPRRCPQLRKSCCSEPSRCAVTGAEVDEAACAACEIRPDKKPEAAPGTARRK